MKVLVIGSGGREHALCWRLSKSKLVEELYCAPGNPGTAEVAENLNYSVDHIPQLVEFAAHKGIDLTIVGPEYPLTLGLVDAFEAAGLRIFGPSKAAARLEGSKAFAKEIMQSCGVPTAAYSTFEEKASALTYIEKIGAPIVIKADGLAAGKGVYVCQTLDEAKVALEELYANPGARVVIEQFLHGKEASFIAAVSNGVILPLASSHDYKRIGDGDEGPNTGGMGTVSPTPRLQTGDEAGIVEQILRPVVNELSKRGIAYKGFLYAGLMIDDSGNYHVLEFNARLGDPEAQVILRRMDFDLAQVLYALSDKEVNMQLVGEIAWRDEASVCLVLAAAGYPANPRSGDLIEGVAKAAALSGIEVFHAGTDLNERGKLVTKGGRVLNITSLGSDVEEARKRAYEAAQLVEFPGAQLRSDIALS